MSDCYICKIASLDEMERKWEYELDRHTAGKGNWIIWREAALQNRRDGKTIPYYGILDGNIICEATAVIHPGAVEHSQGLIDDHTAYLEAFRTNEPFRGQGYFSRLFAFMLNDLRHRGYRRATVGVESEDMRNKAIYTHYGFTEYVKTETASYPDGSIIHVEYYAREIA